MLTLLQNSSQSDKTEQETEQKWVLGSVKKKNFQPLRLQ